VRALLIGACSLLLTSSAQAGKITTIAGSGQSSDGGDSGPAAQTNVGNPFGVEIGPDAALYICEVSNHRLRRLDLKSGQLTTIAGCGRQGYSGDGGPATAALLNEPYEVRFDAQGHIYFVEMQNHVVRRVDAKTGVISTVAGTGQRGFGGDGGDAKAALLANPHSIALDDRGYLYIADIGNHRIRRVEPKSGQIETFAGTGQRRLPEDGQAAKGTPVLGPRALFISGRTLLVALREGHSVWKIDLDAGRWQHVAGTGQRGYSGDGGPAKQATFDGPKGIAVSAAGDVYVVDTENQAIRRIDARTGKITTVAGRGPQHRGYKGDGLPATQAFLNRPHGICVSGDGVVYLGDSENHRVRQVEP
jgi:streptogramin lyase